MKILFCTQCEISPHLGASKVSLEVAAAMKPFGWECEFLALPSLVGDFKKDTYVQDISEAFRAYLKKSAARYDVIDFDHCYLPFPREEFSPNTLLVARSVLLLEHLAHISIPIRQTLPSKLKQYFFGNPAQKVERQAILSARTTLAQADMINVPNDDDRIQLEQIGINSDKITVIPYGTWWKDWTHSTDNVDQDSPPTLVFLGTFDYRKGCLDLVEIVREVFTQIPDCRLKLLGVAGMFPTEKQIRAFFPEEHQHRIDLVLKFSQNELPSHLRGTTLGIFPSYLEGFGMGVVEMVAGGVPVLAYRTPGPSSILPDFCLNERGNTRQLAQKAIDLLRSSDRRAELTRECAVRCEKFDWPSIGQKTSEVYLQALQKLRASRAQSI